MALETNEQWLHLETRCSAVDKFQAILRNSSLRKSAVNDPLTELNVTVPFFGGAMGRNCNNTSQ